MAGYRRGATIAVIPLPSLLRATWQSLVWQIALHCHTIHIEAIGKGGSRVIMAGCRRGLAEILPRTTVIIEYKIRIS